MAAITLDATGTPTGTAPLDGIMDFHERIAANAATVEAHLNAYLDTYEHQPVVDAMRYAVQGGKRMRHMVIESAAMFGISMEQSIWPAAAIEAVHAYSLVHDDMP